MEIVSNRHNNFSELCLVEANTYLEGCRVDLPPSPLTQPFVEPVRVIVLALDPNQIPTTLFAGNVGTTGVMKSAPATALSWFMSSGICIYDCYFNKRSLVRKINIFKVSISCQGVEACLHFIQSSQLGIRVEMWFRSRLLDCSRSFYMVLQVLLPLTDWEEL
jgi:hypothetical protein